MSERPDIDAIRARADAASAGPWVAVSEDLGGRERWEHFIKVPDPARRCATLFHDGSPTQEKPFAEWTHNYRDDTARADVQFMAAARQDIPALLAYVAYLEARR